MPLTGRYEPRSRDWGRGPAERSESSAGTAGATLTDTGVGAYPPDAAHQRTTDRPIPALLLEPVG